MSNEQQSNEQQSNEQQSSDQHTRDQKPQDAQAKEQETKEQEAAQQLNEFDGLADKKPEDLTPEELRLMADTMPGEGPGD